MSPDPKREPAANEPTGTPELEQQDWEAIESGNIAPESTPENGDFRYDEEPDGELPGEDDDNPYQGSDEALPDDQEEREISRDPSKEEAVSMSCDDAASDWPYPPRHQDDQPDKQ